MHKRFICKGRTNKLCFFCSISKVVKCLLFWKCGIRCILERVCSFTHFLSPQDEVLTVIRRVDENWAEGMLGDKIGIFPILYVEVKWHTNTNPLQKCR